MTTLDVVAAPSVATTPARWWVDPRTKIAVLLVVNVVSLSPSGSLESWYARCAAMLFVAAMWVMANRIRLAIGLCLSYAAAVTLMIWSRELPGYLALVGTIGTLIVQFVPVIGLAVWAVSTTQVSELVASLERMKVPSQLVIPLSVVLRFFPTIAQEHRSIGDAMRMRGIGWRGRGRNPIVLMEYRVVPLLMSLVRIGDELTAAALTRGLGGSVQRTNICRVGFSWRDATVMMVALIPAALAIYAGVVS